MEDETHRWCLLLRFLWNPFRPFFLSRLWRAPSKVRPCGKIGKHACVPASDHWCRMPLGSLTPVGSVEGWKYRADEGSWL